MKKKNIMRKNYNMPRPEEQGGMPHHRHCPHGKHREDRNPKYHEDPEKDIAHQKDVARIIA
jgi:hypothetical protein